MHDQIKKIEIAFTDDMQVQVDQLIESNYELKETIDKLNNKLETANRKPNNLEVR